MKNLSSTNHHIHFPRQCLFVWVFGNGVVCDAGLYFTKQICSIQMRPLLYICLFSVIRLHYHKNKAIIIRLGPMLNALPPYPGPGSSITPFTTNPCHWFCMVFWLFGLWIKRRRRYRLRIVWQSKRRQPGWNNYEYEYKLEAPEAVYDVRCVWLFTQHHPPFQIASHLTRTPSPSPLSACGRPLDNAFMYK